MESGSVRSGHGPTLVIGSDICPIRRNAPLFERGDAQAIFSDILPELQEADLTIVNLECPFVGPESPPLGPCLRFGAGNRCVAGLQQAGIDVVGLANNHILDHGPEGLINTMRVCREAGLKHVGAGRNLEEATRILPCEVQGVRIGVLACAEHEPCIAGRTSPGANPASAIDFARSMRRFRGDYDYIIVLLHGGAEFYAYPTPKLVQMCRFMVEQGANIVVCQHSHYAGCLESHESGHIIYGQGNLIFDAHPQYGGEWNRGFLVKLSLGAGVAARVDLVPYVQSDDRPGARRMDRDEEKRFLHALWDRSAHMRQEGFVEEQWRQFCQGRRYRYFSLLRGHHSLLRRLNARTRFSDLLYSRKGLTVLLNILRCETHHEILETMLQDMLTRISHRRLDLSPAEALGRGAAVGMGVGGRWRGRDRRPDGHRTASGADRVGENPWSGRSPSVV